MSKRFNESGRFPTRFKNVNSGVSVKRDDGQWWCESVPCDSMGEAIVMSNLPEKARADGMIIMWGEDGQFTVYNATGSRVATANTLKGAGRRADTYAAMSGSTKHKDAIAEQRAERQKKERELQRREQERQKRRQAVADVEREKLGYGGW